MNAAGELGGESNALMYRLFAAGHGFIILLAVVAGGGYEPALAAMLQGREITQALMPPMPRDILPASCGGASQPLLKTKPSCKARTAAWSSSGSSGVGNSRPCS